MSARRREEEDAANGQMNVRKRCGTATMTSCRQSTEEVSWPEDHGEGCVDEAGSGGMLLECRQASMLSDALLDRFAAFRAIAAGGQIVQDVAASFAKKIGFIRDHGGDTRHIGMLHSGAGEQGGLVLQFCRVRFSGPVISTRWTVTGPLKRTLPLLLTLILGCDRSGGALPSTRPGTTQPAPVVVPAPATTRAAAEPVSMLIDGQPHDFPPARLVLGSEENQVLATLFSDDPPSAANDDYTGNSFFLEMNPVIPETGSLAGAQVDYQAANSEQVDEVVGIYLNGRRTYLQPYQLHVEFQNSESPVKITLSGTFVRFDNADERSAGKHVAVRAELSARVMVESPAK
jgi:hypothetical protein